MVWIYLLSKTLIVISYINCGSFTCIVWLLPVRIILLLYRTILSIFCLVQFFFTLITYTNRGHHKFSLFANFLLLAHQTCNRECRLFFFPSHDDTLLVVSTLQVLFDFLSFKWASYIVMMVCMLGVLSKLYRIWLANFRQSILFKPLVGQFRLAHLDTARRLNYKTSRNSNTTAQLTSQIQNVLILYHLIVLSYTIWIRCVDNISVVCQRWRRHMVTTWKLSTCLLTHSVWSTKIVFIPRVVVISWETGLTGGRDSLCLRGKILK